MLVVIVILALASAAIVPTVANMKVSSDYHQTISGVRRFAAEARERAIQNGTQTQVIYDESKKQLQIQDVQSDGTATTAKTISLLGGVEPQKLQLQGKDSNSSDFKLTFAPDGRSNGGGIEFQGFAVSVDTSGYSKFITGPLPDPNQDQWQAGNLEQRN
jgi:type II secretory pathway pseudopilin PulG